MNKYPWEHKSSEVSTFSESGTDESARCANSPTLKKGTKNGIKKQSIAKSMPSSTHKVHNQNVFLTKNLFIKSTKKYLYASEKI